VHRAEVAAVSAGSPRIAEHEVLVLGEAMQSAILLNSWGSVRVRLLERMTVDLDAGACADRFAGEPDDALQ
jgi:hypothetical protein